MNVKICAQSPIHVVHAMLILVIYEKAEKILSSKVTDSKYLTLQSMSVRCAATDLMISTVFQGAW